MSYGKVYRHTQWYHHVCQIFLSLTNFHMVSFYKINSMGVICYVLLAGYPPFYDEDQKRLFKKIKEGRYHFHEDYWSNTSPEVSKNGHLLYLWAYTSTCCNLLIESIHTCAINLLVILKSSHLFPPHRRSTWSKWCSAWTSPNDGPLHSCCNTPGLL